MNNKPYGNLIIFGASSGIGQAVAAHLAPLCQQLFTVSRRPTPIGQWIQTDLSQRTAIQDLQRQLNNTPIDGLLYLGGTWEKGAFTPDYQFDTCSDADLVNVLNVNLLAPIRVIQQLLPNLRQSPQAKILLMGAAIGGLNFYTSPEVANTASKFGLRGLVFSLRQTLAAEKIGLTLINPGYVATEEVLQDFAAIDRSDSYAIPLQDLFAVIEMVLRLSNRSNINEIDMANMSQ